MAVVIFRHVYHLSREDVSRLPLWERQVLLQGGKDLLQLEEFATGDVKGRELSDAEVRSIITSGVGVS